MSHPQSLTATPPAAVPATLGPISVTSVAPWLLLAALLVLVGMYFVSAEQGATALLSGTGVHEWVHDGRHLLGFPATDAAEMISPRDFLVRGLLAGLLAGFVAFGVAYVVGEPDVNAAIAIEESGTAAHDHAADDGAATEEHTHATDETVVPRSLQSTLGLLTATGVAGVTLGGLVGALSALALGRVGRLGVRGSTLLVAGTGFVAVYLVPFVAYPPNPPAVGQAGTIGYRTMLYFVLLAISVIAATVAIMVGTRLRARIGGWYAALAAGAGYFLAVGIAIALLPGYDEVPAGFPAELLYDFRTASLLTQLSLWLVLGLGLAELVHRKARRSALTDGTRTSDPARV